MSDDSGYVVVMQTKVSPEVAEQFDALAESMGLTRYALLKEAISILLASTSSK